MNVSPISEPVKRRAETGSFPSAAREINRMMPARYWYRAVGDFSAEQIASTAD